MTQLPIVITHRLKQKLKAFMDKPEYWRLVTVSDTVMVEDVFARGESKSRGYFMSRKRRGFSRYDFRLALGIGYSLAS